MPAQAARAADRPSAAVFRWEPGGPPGTMSLCPAKPQAAAALNVESSRMHHLPTSAAALCLALVAAFAVAAAARADFPPVSELPARPELPDPLVMLNGDRVTTKEQWL